MRDGSRFLLGFVTAAMLLLGLGDVAPAASPSLSVILPRGLQRGAETVLTFHGGQLADAKEILFFSPGFQVTKLEPSAGAVKATVKVAPDCRLGEHVAHVRCASGLTEYRTFYVGPLKEISEKEPNSEFKTPQPIPLNVTVNGVIDSEDVDYFVVDAKKGQRISVEVEGMRLGVTMFDPYIAILDSRRFELATADDTPLLKQDAATSIVAPADGKYIIQVRDSSYGGNGSCYYRLHVGTFPRPIAVYPAGGKLGDEVEVRFLGDPTGDIVKKVKLPTQPIPNFGLVPQDATGTAPSDVPFRLSTFGNVLEKEPNNSIKEATPAADLPRAFNGILQTAGDVDYFRFKAKKGETYEIECFGRRIRSAIDPVMVLHNAAGQGLASNDDSRGPDAYFRYTFPADGEYVLSVYDHLQRGGPGFVYRVEFLPVEPKVTTGLPQVARYSQFRQQVYVARGNRFGAVVTASRENFGGELILDPKNVPKGVKIIADPMPANASSMPVVFEAAPDAPLAGALIDLQMRHADPKQKISGGFFNHAEFVISAPGQSLFSWCDVDRMGMAVLEEIPYKLEIVEPKVPLVQSGLMQLKIRAIRKAGFTEPINVQVPFLPPGVSGVPSIDIPKGQNEVLFPLNANGGAEVKKWKIFALGSANVNGAAWSSSQMANLEVTAPYLQFAMQRAAVEQGQQTEMVCNVTVTHPFEGKAKVQVLGFPPKVTTPEMELTKDTKDLVFKVSTDKGSPAGTHKNIFCQAIVMEHGEPVLHYVGGTELRIDQPLPAPTKPAAPPAAVAKKESPKAKPAEAKRLTRLEQLRLDAKQKAQAVSAK